LKQKKKWEDEQAKKLAEKARREKEEDRKYKERVKENIRLDKERREAELKKLQGAQPQQPSTVPVTATVATPTVVPVKKEFTECVVQLRMPDGRSFQGTFKPTDPLRSVLTLLSSNGIVGNYALMSNFPKKVYFGAALDSTTLQQADLVPRGSLMVTTNF